MAEEALNQEQEQHQEPIIEETPQEFTGAIPSFLQNLEEEQETETETESETETQTESETESETETETETEEEGEPISSVSDLIESQEWDQEWFNGLKVPIKVNGQPAEATFQDLINSYQTQEAATQRLEEAKSKAQEANQQIAQERESLKADLGTAAGLVHLAEQLFNQDISEANLAKLRDENPEQYLIEKDRFAERRQALETVKQQLKSNVQKALQPAAPTAEDFKKARESLIKEVPDLANEEECQRLAKHLVERGYKEEEIANNVDHRLFRDAYKAMLYDELQSKAEPTKKKVASIPRMMKPGPQKQRDDKPKDAAEVLYGK